VSLVPLTAKAATPKPSSLIGQAVDSEPTDAPSPAVAPDSTEIPTPKADPAPPAPPDSLDSLSFEALDAKVLEIGKQFGKLDPGTHLATFDAKAAKDAGYDSDIIRLVKEQVDFQNDLVGALKSGKTRMGEFKPSAEKYPKLKRFHDRAAAEAKKPKSKTSLSSTLAIKQHSKASQTRR